MVCRNRPRPLGPIGPHTRWSGKAAQVQETRVQQKGKILVVDDDRLVLATLTHGLAQAGFEVIDADNGDDAILLARQHRPELALLDIRMEGKTGFDVAAYLREYCQIPFMFLSAFSDEATVNQVKKLGALTYLVKPLDIQQIVPAVEAAFANRGRHAVAPTLTSPAPASVQLDLAPASNESAVPSAPNEPAAAAAAAVASAPSASTASTSSTSAATTPASSPSHDTVAVAIGILMHRYSMTRRQALERLEHQCRQEGCSIGALSERVAHAQEVLAGLGSL